MKTKRLAGKVALVTGGSQGIGKNIVRSLGKEGARVVSCGIHKAEGKRMVSQLAAEGIDVSRFEMDLRLPGNPQRMVRKVIKEYGRIDILVNNAKSGKRLPLLSETEASWTEGLSVTLTAAFFASQEAIRSMQTSGGGVIVNISSVTADVAGHDAPIYHIAKAGMIQMTKYLALHAGGSHIRVNAVVPGFIVKDEHIDRYNRSDNIWYRELSEFAHPVGRTGRSDDVASAVLFLASPDASFISGACLVVDGGLTIQDQSNILFRYTHKETP